MEQIKVLDKQLEKAKEDAQDKIETMSSLISKNA